MREAITRMPKRTFIISMGVGLLAAALAAMTAACAGVDEEPVCGDGVCEVGESTACSDCSPDPDPDPDPDPEPGDASLLVRNNSSHSVWYLYVASCSSPTWGSDQLGS